MSPITTHVLDTRLGQPAIGLAVALERQDEDAFQPIAKGVTNADGRISDLLADDALVRGVYRIRFDTGSYFSACDVEGFYPEVTVVFEITEATAHYHVPLLLSPFGYSTYRGS